MAETTIQSISIVSPQIVFINLWFWQKVKNIYTKKTFQEELMLAIPNYHTFGRNQKSIFFLELVLPLKIQSNKNTFFKQN